VSTKTTPLQVDEIEAIARGIRWRVLEHTLANNGGYMSQACSAAELLACLYGGMVNLPAVDSPLTPRPFPGVPAPGGVNRASGVTFHGGVEPGADRLIISPAHYALVVYAALIETNRLDSNGLQHFNKDGSTVEMIGAEHSPGFETTTGSLAQALSHALGIALAKRAKGDAAKTWVFMSDGEFQEGQTWEALQAASHYRVDTLRAIVDVNQAQCDGPMDTVMSIEPLAARVESFGWEVHKVDGHDIRAILDAGATTSDKPKMILCYTDPVRGLPLMNDRRPVLHYLRFKSDEERSHYQAAFEEMPR